MYTLLDGEIPLRHSDAFCLFYDLTTAIAFINRHYPQPPGVFPSPIVPQRLNSRQEIYNLAKRNGIDRVVECASDGSQTVAIVEGEFSASVDCEP